MKFITVIVFLIASVSLAEAQVRFGHGTGALANKVAEIQAACGSRVVSAFRKGARKPNGHISEHALGRAVDMQGNPSCIYARLRNWPGGYSTDYYSAPGTPHVHISYGPGGAEWGRRFAHARTGGSSRHASASRRTRHASAAGVSPAITSHHLQAVQ